MYQMVLSLYLSIKYKMKYNIDLSLISENLCFSMDETIELVDIFLVSTKETLGLLSDAIDKNNLEDIRKLAHAIKGNSANLWLQDISCIAKEMEFAAKNSEQLNYLEKFKELEKLILKIEDKND